jgi:hypothetical protein
MQMADELEGKVVARRSSLQVHWTQLNSRHAWKFRANEKAAPSVPRKRHPPHTKQQFAHHRRPKEHVNLCWVLGSADLPPRPASYKLDLL